MHDIIIQIENSEKNRNELLHDLFNSDSWSAGMHKDIPGGATITLKRVPMQKVVDAKSLITLGLDFASTVSATIVANWLTQKFFGRDRSHTIININEMHVHSPESFKRRVTRLAGKRKPKARHQSPR